jgi:hypothetical protein
MENSMNGFEHIKGWGIDADPENEPTYPMKKYTGDDHKRLNYKRPAQQPVTVEILRSNERPNVTATFGTFNPPSGISGMIRRYAFQFSEGSFGHWIPLILADRVNAIEGIVDDLRNGHFPNIVRERGWTAEWKYNKKSLLTKLFTGVFLIALAGGAMYAKNKMKKFSET